jgi:hypothetical protein
MATVAYALLSQPALEYAATKRRQTEGWFAYCIDNIWHWAASESSLAGMLGREYRLVRNDRLVVPELRDLIPEEED